VPNTNNQWASFQAPESASTDNPRGRVAQEHVAGTISEHKTYSPPLNPRSAYAPAEEQQTASNMTAVEDTELRWLEEQEARIRARKAELLQRVDR